MQKNRISVTNPQRLFMLRELSSIREGLNEDLALSDISNEGRTAIVDDLNLVNDLIRKLERHSPYKKGENY